MVYHHGSAEADPRQEFRARKEMNMAEQKPKKVRIGFVGVGTMGQCAHLRNYAALPECEVVALAELRPNLAKQVAARYGVPRVYASHEEMLAKEHLDGLVSAQQFTRHGTLMPELLKARLPLFTEKPIAGSIEMGEKVVAAAKASGTFLMVGYHKRSDPATMAMKRELGVLMDSGELGRLRYVRITMPAGDWIAGGFNDLIQASDAPLTIPGDPPPSDMDEATYNAYLTFVNYYIHQVNLMRHLLGEPYTVTFADAAGVLLVGRSASGVTCAIEMSPYNTTVDWQESALVAFERGWLRLDLPAPLALNRPGRLTLFKDPGNGAPAQTLVPQLPWVHAMRQQAVNFIRAVRGEIPPMTDAAEALEDLRVARDYLRLRTGH
jgi:predicted dehydrogenase